MHLKGKRLVQESGKAVVRGTLFTALKSKCGTSPVVTAPAHSPFHVERSELKLDAPKNIMEVSLTDDISHCDKSWLKANASQNM
jgi:hypothetical protein